MRPGGRGLRRCALVVLELLAGLSIGMGASPAAAQSSATDARDAPETLRPGDRIRVRVWREPELSGEFPVNEAGVVVLPKLGPVEVTAQPAESLKARLARQIGMFLNHSSVDIVLLRRVQIMGAVQRPGLYHLDPTMSVGDALALAGGVLPEGRPDQVEVVRASQGLRSTVSGRTLLRYAAVRSGDQLYVPQRSWISRNPGTILAGISAVTTLLYLVAR
jgi:protein involved in polysaccharide export with SLBB domain